MRLAGVQIIIIGYSAVWDENDNYPKIVLGVLQILKTNEPRSGSRRVIVCYPLFEPACIGLGQDWIADRGTMIIKTNIDYDLKDRIRFKNCFSSNTY